MKSVLTCSTAKMSEFAVYYGNLAGWWSILQQVIWLVGVITFFKSYGPNESGISASIISAWNWRNIWDFLGISICIFRSFCEFDHKIGKENLLVGVRKFHLHYDINWTNLHIIRTIQTVIKFKHAFSNDSFEYTGSSGLFSSSLGGYLWAATWKILSVS